MSMMAALEDEQLISGPQVRDHRLRRRLTQQELAHAAGIDPTELSKIENGWRPLRPKKAEALMRALAKYPAVRRIGG